MGFGPPVTPQVIKTLMIATAAAFLVQELNLLGSALETRLAAVPALFWYDLNLWQPLTYMFLHGGLMHLAMNMFMLWMFGSQLAMAWGEDRFLRYYLLCGVGAGVIIVTYPMVLSMLGFGSNLAIPTIGASGAIYGVILGFSLTWPDRTIVLLFPPIPFKAIWLIPILFFMTLYFDRGNTSHIGHLGGVLIGYLLIQGSGDGGGFSLDTLKHKWRRLRMRRRLRAVQSEERRERDRFRNLH
jgi:membrane associated rhomboid family serine protease